MASSRKYYKKLLGGVENMDKIYEILSIDKLDEAKQTELKTEIETLIESASVTKANEMLSEEKEKMVEELETKFEDYKDDLVTKFSNFVDDILQEEMTLPENIVEFARLGEQYHDLIEQFKTKLAIDEGVLDTETKNVLREAKNEILKLKKEKDVLTSESLTLKVTNDKLSNEKYLSEKCSGLTSTQETHVRQVLEGYDKAEIDKKFDILVKSFGDVNEEEEKDMMECPECGAEIKKDSKECPECGTKLKEEKKEEKKKVEEVTNPKDEWLRILRENTL